MKPLKRIRYDRVYLFMREISTCTSFKKIYNIYNVKKFETKWKAWNLLDRGFLNVCIYYLFIFTPNIVNLW